MSLVSAAIPNLVNGVSQQPFVQRLTSQGSLQLNGYSSLVEGLRKRPPSNHIAKIASAPLNTNTLIHTINRSGGEQYEVIFDGTQIQVFDMLGNAKTVSAPNGWGYVTTSNPTTDLSVTTVADYTFIANKTVTVTNDGTLAPAGNHTNECIVWTRSGNYSTSYVLTVAWTIGGTNYNASATYRTPDPVTVTVDGSGAGSDVSTESAITTEEITAILLQLLTTGTAGSPFPTFGGSSTFAGTTLPSATFTTANVGSSIYIAADSIDFAVVSTSGNGDTDIVVNKGAIQNFSNLPAKCLNGVVFQVSGLGNDGTNNDYWVRFQGDSGAQTGLWVECAKPGEVQALAPATMPYQLIRNGDGTFTFQQSTWTARAAGDLAECPLPSFVGNTINYVFFYQGRLGFLSGENAILSQTSEVFNFMRLTALQLLDNDVIDISSTNSQAAVLKAAVPFQGFLLLFADVEQFQLTFNQLLSPKTVAITPATNYECNLDNCIPVGAGSSVFFSFDRGGQWTGINEYYLDGVTRINSANEITSQVPYYLPGVPLKMTASVNEGCLVVLSAGDRTSMFVYRYFWQQGTKLQASWSQWQFATGDTILSAEFIQNTLFIVINRADGTYLESIAIQPGTAEAGEDFLIHLDRKVYWDSTGVSVSYNPTTNLTSVTLPYVVPDWTQMVCVAWGGAGPAIGRKVSITGTNGTNSCTISGNVPQFILGRGYTFRYRFSTFITREPVPLTYSMQAVTDGRLSIRYVLVNYTGTGYFRFEVTPYARDMSTYVFDGGNLGDINTKVGAVTLSTGTLKVPVQCRNTYAQIDLVNDSYLPCFFESAGWEGFFVLRSRRVS